MGRRRGVVGGLPALLAMVLSVVGAPVALADFPQDPPDDPFFDQSDETFPTCHIPPIDQQYQLFSHMPLCGPLAQDPEDTSGNSIETAWADFTTGRPDVLIAYVEGGVNWLQGDPQEIADKTFINPGEVPDASDPRYTDNGDPWFNAPDFPGTADHNGNGFLDPEDIIVEFSDGVDDDANGYVDDISGWDFYHDQNDPMQTDRAYTHTNGQMKAAAAITDNGEVEAGICPLCMLLPIKAGAEALDRTDDLAEAWLFAADSGADVIVSVTADLGYSTFMEEAIRDIADRGVLMVEASNDFNSTDHQGGMFHEFVLPGNGMVANSVGMEQLADATTLTYQVRSGFTSWGVQNVFTPTTIGGTTSEATPTVGGILALVLAWGRDAAEQGLIDAPLDSWEVLQVVRDAAFDIDDATNPWPNQPGWDLQYGYGRPHVHRAMQAIADGDIPPVAILRGPRWFTLVDPSEGGTVEVTGTARTTRSATFDWELQWALGPQPLDEDFEVFATGSGTGEQRVSGTFDLSEVPEDHYAEPMSLSQTKTLETAERYAVTFRLQVTDAEDRMGEDRRAIFAHHDDTWADHFPMEIGPGGEGQAALVDLAGLGHLQIVFSDTDGFVHAVDPMTGRELDGFPVALADTEVTRDHAGVRPRHHPAPGNVAVGDLDHTGELQIVVTTSTGTVYVIEDDGTVRDGWPKALDRGIEPPRIPRGDHEFFREPWQGAFASPALYDLDGDGALEVIQAGWDGHVHVWNGDGGDAPGWPLKVELPEDYSAANGRFIIQDHKLSATPAIADLDGDGDVELVLNTQFNETRGSGLQPNGASNLVAYHHDGTPVDGWPARLESAVMFYGSAQEFITEGINMPVAADVDGDGDDEIAANPLLSPTYVLDGDGSVRSLYAPPGFDPTALPDTIGGLADLVEGLPGDVPIGFTTSGAFGAFNGVLSHAQPTSGALSIATSLLAAGSGLPIVNYERVVEAGTGAPRPGFPSELQGLNFLGAPLFVDVDGDGAAEIVDGGDSGAVHAYTSGGGQADGFPKFNTGWALWSPSAGDLDGDGDLELVQAVREGSLFVWETSGVAEANTEWWSWRHDEWNTGRYGLDTRPPGILRDVVRDGDDLTFTAPGDDWYTSSADHYLVTLADGSTEELAADVAAGGEQTLTLPAGARRIQAVDEVGNLGRAFALTSAPAPSPPIPVDDPIPTPTTGGGAELVGLLLLAGALAARPRRGRSLR